MRRVAMNNKIWITTDSMDETGRKRRQFIKTLSWMAGSALISPGLSWGKHLLSDFSYDSGAVLRIGILKPASPIIPGLGRNFADGLKSCFDSAKTPIKPLLIEVEPGPGLSGMVKAVKQLLELEQVDVLTGFFKSDLAEEIGRLLEKHQTHCIMNTMGASFSDKQTHSHCLVKNSLNYWKSAFAMGDWASKNLGKRAVISTSLYESGFDSLYAFRLGFEQGGGIILETRITGIPAQGTEKTLHTRVRESELTDPDFVYAAYSGKDAVKFIHKYKQSVMGGGLPLIGSSFLTDQAVLDRCGKTAEGIITCQPWADQPGFDFNGFDTSEHALFSETFTSRTQRDPDVFALMGYDTGRLLHNMLSSTSTSRNEIKDIVNPPMFIRKTVASGDRLMNRVIDRLETVSDQDKYLLSRLPEVRSGWSDMYLNAWTCFS